MDNEYKNLIERSNITFRMFLNWFFRQLFNIVPKCTDCKHSKVVIDMGNITNGEMNPTPKVYCHCFDEEKDGIGIYSIKYMRQEWPFVCGMHAWFFKKK